MSTNLSLRVIGDKGQCPLETFEFYAGEKRTLTLQLYDVDQGSRICIPTGAVKTLTLSGSPNNLVIADALITIDPVESSIFSVAISDVMSEAMISGGIQFSYSVGSSVIRVAYLKYGLKKLIGIA